MRLRDELGPIYRDEMFAPLFSQRGRPAETPWRLALVSVMQFAERLSDRRAADAVRARIDWKYALGLPLDDPGFDSTVSLVDDGAVAVIQVEELGQLGGRGLAVVAAIAALLVAGQEGDGHRGPSGGGMGAHAIAANGQLAAVTGITHGCHQTGRHTHPCPVTGA
jgi:transposase-like protein DUF772